MNILTKSASLRYASEFTSESFPGEQRQGKNNVVPLGYDLLHYQRVRNTHACTHTHTRTQKYIQDVTFHKLENFNLKYCLLLECDIIIQTPLDHKLIDSVVTLHSLFNIKLFSDNVEAYTFPTPTPKVPCK